METQPPEAQQPNVGGRDVSDSDTGHLFQYQVDEGVDHSEVALHTGEDREKHLSIPGENPNE